MTADVQEQQGGWRLGMVEDMVEAIVTEWILCDGQGWPKKTFLGDVNL